MVEADLLVDLTGVTLRYQMEFTITNYIIMIALNILFKFRILKVLCILNFKAKG